MKQIVVTGIGILGPWGKGKEVFWETLQEGKPVFQKVSVNTSPLKSVLGGEIKELNYSRRDALFNQANKFCQYTVIAAEDAIRDASLEANKGCSKIAAISSTTVGYPTLNQFSDMLSPLKSQYIYYHTAIGLVCIRNKIKGATFTITSGEASGAHAIGWGANLIRWGRCRVAVVGGTDILSRFSFLHYASLKELSPLDEQEEKCTPFDKNRNGIIISESAGFIVLEDAEYAKERGAHIYGEIAGYGSSHDWDSPRANFSSQGEGLKLSMECALQDASIGKEEIDYIYTAANGSKILDSAESIGIRRLLGLRRLSVPITNIKGVLGETLSVGGVFNVISAILTINNRIIFPVVNLAVPEYELNYVTEPIQRDEINIGMCNSASYGGNYATLIVRRFKS